MTLAIFVSYSYSALEDSGWMVVRQAIVGVVDVPLQRVMANAALKRFATAPRLLVDGAF